MSKFTNFRKSKLLLFMLLALFAGGVSPAWAQKALPYEFGFEDDSEMASWTKTSTASNTGKTNYSKRTGSWCFQFYYNTNPPQYLISPELEVTPTGVNVSFYYRKYSSYGTETFAVGYSTNTTSVNDFTFGDLISDASDSEWKLYSNSFPSGTKYISIKYTANDQYRLYIDDFKAEEIEAYKKPKDFAFTDYTATSASFTWTNGGEESAWQIAYSATQGFDAESVIPVDVTTNPYTLTGLTAETTYYARIRADYGSGNYSKWSDEISFKPSAATNTTVNDGSGSNGYVPFYGSYADTDGTMSQFITPSSSLTAIQDRQITKLTFYGTANLDFGTAKFKVYMKETDATSFANTTFDWTDMDEVADANVSTDSEGKLVVELESPFDYSDGNLMIGFKISTTGSWKSTSWTGISSTGSAIYSYNGNASSAAFLPKMTITSLPQVATIKKPKNFDDSETTTTTATLGWTNGGDETAWQIAYSTEADFNPDTEGTKVAADTNPFTLTGLTAATTYYAYIRAEKGGEYSGWSNKADFTTLAAVPVIGLSTTSHNFGLVNDADAQALTLTITNSGGAELTGLTVTPSSGFAVTDAEGNALTATTIAASSSLTVKVKVSALGQQDGTITIDGNEIEAMTVNVSGYMLDDSKILETFATAESVSRWTVGSGWTFNTTTGAYSGTSSRIMSSPKLSVANGDVLTLNVKLGWNGGSLIVEGLDADGNTVYNAVTYNASNGGLNTSNFTLLTISDMPTTVAKVKLTGYYAYINLFNGFTYANDPVLALYSNEACTTVQASPATKNFGFATEAQQQKYYIKNTGNGQIDLTIEQADGFTAAVDDTALEEYEKATLTLTMTATEGLHEGTITVTAKNHDNDDVLGTFVVNANGAITGEKNNVVLTAFPAGWQNNNWTISNGAARNWSSTSSDLITTKLIVTEGEKLLVEAYKYYSDDNSQLSYSYSTDNGTTWSEAVSLTNSLTTDYRIVAISGIPAGNVLMKFSGTYTYIRQIYGFKAVSEPILTFAAAGMTKNFGMINSATTTDAYTIKNEGSALLDNLSVECNNTNFSITVAGNATSIAANGEVTFTVTLNTSAIGMQEGVVTISGDDVTAKAFNIKGYVVDSSKEYVTFTAAPDRWENSGWTFDSNGATAGYNSNATIISPKVALGTSPSLAISAKLQSNSSSYYVKVEGYNTETSDWTYSKTLSNGENEFNSTDYSVVVISDIPATVNRLRLVGNYVVVNGLTGFTYDDNDPKFGVFSDSEFASKITTGNATNSWGFVSEDKSATYYIKNTGTGTMTLSKTDAPAGFTAELGKNSLGAGESTTLTISMANDAENNEGYHAGDVVLTAKDNADNELGTFIITSSGIVVSSAKDIDFTKLSALPAGWETSNWTVTANTKLSVGGTQGTLTTSYKVSEGESLVIVAKQQYSGYGKLSYRYKTTGDFSASKDITPSSTSYEIKPISDIPAAEEVVVEFTGQYIDIQRIYGYTKVDKPGMALDKTGDYDFGMQTADAEYVITVTNNGTAELTGLTATLATGTDYSVKVSKTTLAVNESATVTVTQKFDASKGLASLSDVLTISADDVAGKTIKLSGKTRDASKWYVDFASGISSDDFISSEGWSSYNGSAYVGYNNGAVAKTLVTKVLTLTANEKLQFKAKLYSSGGTLKVRSSVNGGISWSDYTEYNVTSTSEWVNLEYDLQNTESKDAMIEFLDYYVYLDDIYGGTINTTAPMISVTKGGTAVESGLTEAFGQILEESTATYTITNPGNGTLTITSPVATTGDATATVDNTSLTKGQSATLTITMPVKAPYGAKEGAVTVATSLGDFVIKYTATTMDPDALNVDFSDGTLPAAWYNDGWTLDYQDKVIYRSNSSSDSYFMTQKLEVTGENDVLVFDAKKYGTKNASSTVLKVSCSTDRVHWTEVGDYAPEMTTDFQTFEVKGLAAGEYYLKFTGHYATVDNIKGWKKVAGIAHDLYVTATNIPTTLSASYTATATVTSLIAAEEGVYAKLFFGDNEVATSEPASVALNGTTTFTMTTENAPTEKDYYAAKIVVYYSDGTVAFETATAHVGTFTLDDEQDFTPDMAGNVAVVKVNRSFNAGWGTVVLPFNVTSTTVDEKFGEGTKLYTLSSYDSTTGELVFGSASSIEAGKPYLINLPAAITDGITFTNNVTISDANNDQTDVNGAAFKGNYDAGMSMAGKYGVTPAGKMAKGGANSTMKAFRSYIELPAGAAPARLVVYDETTGISRVLSTEEVENMNIFNLKGQHVGQSAKGVLIIGGKKVIKK